MRPSIADMDSVDVFFENNTAMRVFSTIGYYKLYNDKIFIRTDATDIEIVHELRHAHNATKFRYLNTNADEISARATEILMELDQWQYSLHIADSVIKHNHIPMTPNFNAGLERIGYSTPGAKLRVRSRLLVDPDITIRDLHARNKNPDFKYAIMDEQKNLGVAAAIISNITNVQKLVRPSGTHALLPREINYKYIVMDSDCATSVLNGAIDMWNVVKNTNQLYIMMRYNQVPANCFNTLDDADLEKLFTFKINGEHQSLYKIASPDVRQRVKDACNGQNPVYAWRRNRGRGE